MSKLRLNSPSSRQRGSTLFISLVFLLVLTVLGIAGVSTTGIQERMAHNVREKNISFQAAESALADGEALVDNFRNGLPPVPQTNCNGNCAAVVVWDSTAFPNLEDQNYTWWQANAREQGVDPVTGADNGLDNTIAANQPYYLVRELDAASLPNLTPQSLGVGFDYGSSGPRYYQVYAYGIGQASYTKDGNTRFFNTLLESVYAIPAF